MEMTAIRPTPAVLEGRFIRLEPLTEAHLPELHAAIGHPIVFAAGYGGGPEGYRATTARFADWARGYYRWSDGNPYAVRLLGGPHDGVIVGTSTLADFDERREHAHIGWTAYDPRVWGSRVNPEAKLLLLQLAFNSGFGRVKIQTDVLNDRSRAAIAGVGATFEGVVRRDMARGDGTWRDSAVFSIIVDEWPDVRTRLEARLAAYGDAPVVFRERGTDGRLSD
jgi:RimJ/RimL family protein N-acetyltransferase